MSVQLHPWWEVLKHFLSNFRAFHHTLFEFKKFSLIPPLLFYENET